MHWVQITDAWNGFVHAQESCAPLVLFRVLFGSLLIVNVLLLFLPTDLVEKMLTASGERYGL